MVMSSVAMHPTTSRTQQRSTEPTPSPLFTNPLFETTFDDADTATPSPAARVARTSVAVAAAGVAPLAPLSPPAQLGKTHGLPSYGSSLPLLSTAATTPIRAITAGQYAALYAEYIDLPIPEEVLFPWCHGGADLVDTPSSNYFGFAKGKAAAVPE